QHAACQKCSLERDFASCHECLPSCLRAASPRSRLARAYMIRNAVSAGNSQRPCAAALAVAATATAKAAPAPSASFGWATSCNHRRHKTPSVRAGRPSEAVHRDGEDDPKQKLPSAQPILFRLDICLANDAAVFFKLFAKKSSIVCAT